MQARQARCLPHAGQQGRTDTLWGRLVLPELLPRSLGVRHPYKHLVSPGLLVPCLDDRFILCVLAAGGWCRMTPFPTSLMVRTCTLLRVPRSHARRLSLSLFLTPVVVLCVLCMMCTTRVDEEPPCNGNRRQRQRDHHQRSQDLHFQRRLLVRSVRRGWGIAVAACCLLLPAAA